ncbi:MAG: UDP-N-acetylenolpyruvoylglucosamine reductase, partial [Acidobacteria bacterium]|nr:UDP-N-acetylenolpyruvoylglucosamine reductase [Acidobacteriota bacterium]
VSESITSVRVFDRRKREIRVIENAACGFQYRRSIFNTTHRERFVVLSATYSLTPGGAPRITYADIVSEFEGREPTLTETRNAVCAIRKSKGMLVRQGGADSRSAGSFFKNPVIGGKDLELIKECADRNGLGAVPSYRVDRDTFKVPAAWLIERSGFKKGFTLGNAGLSTRHSLALTNRGKASAEDIIALKKMIEDRVFEMFGIALEPEPNLIGFSS